MTFLYDVAFIIFAIAYIPYLVLRRKWHRDFPARLGLFPGEIRKELGQKEHIWVHAVSIGEVLAVANLVQNLKSSFPSCRVVISTVTQTGYAVALKTFSPKCLVIYAPLDFSLIVKKFVSLIRPKIYIVMETEIWPNLFAELHRNHVPIVQVNGRISDKAFKRYKRARFLLKKTLLCVSAFLMQSHADKKRIVFLGAPEDKVHVIGNLKFDDLPKQTGFNPKGLEFDEHAVWWVAGSTHPGEEKIVLSIFKSLVKEFSHLRLIIAPRHIERTGEIVDLVKENGLSPLRFSSIAKPAGHQDSVIVVDTIGNLKDLYSMAKLVFVGKSLTLRGGHNIIEPAFFGKPIFIGPHMENFKDIVDVFLREDAVIQVKDADELLLKMRDMLKDARKMDEIGLLAKGVIDKHTGATKRAAEIIAAWLQGA